MKDAVQVLNEVLRYTEKTKNSLAKAIGLIRSQNLYDIEKGKVKNISSELSEKICNAYPEINRQFLLKGEGEMLKTKPDESKNYSQKTTETKTAESEHEARNESLRDKSPTITEKYIGLLEEWNDSKSSEITQIAEALKKVQKDLDDLVGTHLTMLAMGQALQDVVLQNLFPEKHADLRESVHNRGVVLLRALKKKGNHPENGK